MLKRRPHAARRRGLVLFRELARVTAQPWSPYSTLIAPRKLKNMKINKNIWKYMFFLHKNKFTWRPWTHQNLSETKCPRLSHIQNCSPKQIVQSIRKGIQTIGWIASNSIFTVAKIHLCLANLWRKTPLGEKNVTLRGTFSTRHFASAKRFCMCTRYFGPRRVIFQRNCMISKCSMFSTIFDIEKSKS